MYYFAWAHSLVVDGDLDFSNQYAFADQLNNRQKPDRRDSIPIRLSPLGRVINHYPAGLGYASLPLMYLARATVLLYENLSGISVSPFAAVYPLAHIATQTLLAFGGLFLCWRLLRPRYGSRLAFTAILLVFFGTNLGYYTFLSTGYAHTVGFCLNSLFLLTALRWTNTWRSTVLRKDSIWRSTLIAFAMGIILGFSTLVRNTNVHLALVPLTLTVLWTRQTRSVPIGIAIKPALISLFAAGTGFLLGFLPQICAWKQIFGSWLVFSYGSSGHPLDFFYPYPRNLFPILFGRRVGLFLWHPLTAVAVVGLIIAARRKRPLAWAGLVTLAATAWIYGSWGWYDLGFPFGHRGFVDVSAFFMIGLAEIGLRLRTRKCVPKAVWARRITMALVVWNFYLAIAFRADVQPPVTPWAGTGLVTNWSRERVIQLWHDLPILPGIVFNLRKAHMRATANSPEVQNDPALQPTPLLYPIFTPAPQNPTE
jgi:hypothetical protein